MKIEKQFTIDAPQEKVWQFITTPEKAAKCIPGCEEIEIVGESKYKASIKVQVGPIKTTFNVNVETIEERPPEFASYVTTGEEGSKASRLKAESTLSLKQLESNQTEVIYTSDINIVGRLGKFGIGIMKKKADAIGGEFVEALRSRIEDKAVDENKTATGVGADRLSNPIYLWGIGIGVLLLILLLFVF